MIPKLLGKKMKSLFRATTLILSISLAFAVNAQKYAVTDWQDTTTGNSRDTRYSASVQLSSGDIILVGGRENNANDTDLWVKRIDQSGNTVWSTTLSKPGPPGSLYAQVAVIGPAGNIYIACDATGNATVYDTCIFKIDENGVMLASTTIDLYDWDLVSGIDVGPSGNLVVTSSSTDPEQYQVSKLDTNLATLWTTYLGNVGQDNQYPTGPKITANGDILVGGQVNNGVQSDVRLTRLSSLGAILYERTFGDPVLGDSYPRVFQSSTANTYFAYTRKAFDPTSEVKLLQLDQLGNTNWTVSDPDISALFLTQYASGDLLVNGPTFLVPGESSQRFARVTEAGTVVWSTDIVSPNLEHNFTRNISIGPDNIGYTIAHGTDVGLDGTTWVVNAITDGGTPVFQWRLPHADSTYNFPNVLVPLSGGEMIVGGEVGDTLDDDAHIRKMHAEFSVFPLSTTIRLGRLNSGNLVSLVDNDDNYFEMCKFIVPNQSTPPINVEFDSIVPANYPANRIAFKTVGKASTTGLQQNVELWNWTTNAWERSNLQSIMLSEQSSTTLGATASNIQTGTGLVKARVRVAVNGIVLTSSWCVQFDQATWIVRP